MKIKELLRVQLEKGIENINSFSNPQFARHIQISNISISEFTTPEFDERGLFKGGARNFRDEYERIIQKKLSGISNPCLYLFELVSPDSELVLNTYKLFLAKQKVSKPHLKRACSSVNHTISSKDFNPLILYVGKSEKPVDGRIVVHFGYYEKGVAGLQLVHWGKNIDLKLNLHVFEFKNSELFPYLEVIEKLLFTKLRPIVGKR